jgi:hypothetical protein
MVSSPVSREAARAAKATLRECLRGESEVVGLGLTRRDGGYAVKVNLRSGPCAAVPAEVAGVPVVVEIVGLARAR